MTDGLKKAGQRWLPIVLAALCALPSLSLPFMMDDWFHLSALEGWLGSDHPRLPEYFEGWTGPLGEPSLSLIHI